MPVRTVVVCEARVPFIQGGAELAVGRLVDQLRLQGYLAERVSVPFKWYPKEQLLSQAAAWRLVDLSESNGRPIDAVIATKFPTYFTRHPRKVTWLFHQYRAIYDLCGTPYSEFDHSEADVRLRDKLIAADTEALAESKRLFSNARNTASRLSKYNGLVAEPLYHPPPLAGSLKAGEYVAYVLSVGRLELNKRVDMIVGALALTEPAVRLVVAGHGADRRRLDDLVSRLGLADRVTFTGDIDDPQLVDLYANALAVIFPPIDEDYGYVTLEAFLARKPVVTTIDAGGPLEFVEDGVNGIVAEPVAESIAAAMASLAGDRALARRMGAAGFDRAKLVTWTGVVERLVG